MSRATLPLVLIVSILKVGNISMSRSPHLGCLLLFSTIALAAEKDTGEDWPRFLGPRGDNTSLETGLIDKFPPSGPKIAWTQKVGTGYGAPSVRGAQLVLHHRLGDEEVIES